MFFEKEDGVVWAHRLRPWSGARAWQQWIGQNPLSPMSGIKRARSALEGHNKVDRTGSTDLFHGCGSKQKDTGQSGAGPDDWANGMGPMASSGGDVSDGP